MRLGTIDRMDAVISMFADSVRAEQLAGDISHGVDPDHVAVIL